VFVYTFVYLSNGAFFFYKLCYPTGLTGPGPTAVEDELLPPIPMLELALSSKYSIQYKFRFEKHKYL